MNRHRWWRRRRFERDLSAYADGELHGAAAGRVAEALALDTGARRQLARLRAVDGWVQTALRPSAPGPDADAAADSIVAALVRPEAPSSPPARLRWRPVAVASVGLLLTAGIAVVGYRRRTRW